MILVLYCCATSLNRRPPLRDAVFRTFQLALQFKEVLIGLQVRIVLSNGYQAGRVRWLIRPEPAGIFEAPPDYSAFPA